MKYYIIIESKTSEIKKEKKTSNYAFEYVMLRVKVCEKERERERERKREREKIRHFESN